MPVLMFGTWILNEIQIINVSSTSFGISSKLFSFSNKAKPKILRFLVARFQKIWIVMFNINFDYVGSFN